MSLLICMCFPLSLFFSHLFPPQPSPPIHKMIYFYLSFFPILVYNCGTWALTKSEEEKLNAFHRKQLRKVLNIKYPVKITNSSLYNKCEEHPLSIYILENRWRLFGHILRRNIEIPANKSMNRYFATHGKKFRGRPLTTLPVVLNKDLSRLQENTLQLTTREDLEHLRCIAQNRQQWRELSTRIRKAAEAPPSDDWDAEGPKSRSKSKFFFLYLQSF